MRWSGKFDRFDPIGVAVMRELQWNYYYSRIVERVPAMELVFYFVVFAVECFLFGLVAQLLWTRWKRLTGRQAQT